MFEGKKLTGDSNVPMNQITFQGYLTQGIKLTKEQQQDMSCQTLKYKAYPYFENYIEKPRETKQPFVLPPSIQIYSFKI